MKKRKKKTPKHKPVKYPTRDVNYPTPNAEKIARIMKLLGVRGKYKDHVVFSDGMMLDWLGTYPHCFSTDKVHVVHKRLLHMVIGADHARLFWQHGIRTNYGIHANTNSRGNKAKARKVSK